jgi:glycosyltransferase involved in cell wall biosynthesis
MKKKILYATRLDPNNIKSWSGTTFFILKCLKSYFSVTSVGPLNNRIRIFYIFKRVFFSLFGIKFDIDRPILCAKDFSNQIQKKIKNINYDAIVTSEPYLISFLKTNKPIYVFTDLTFNTYYKHYFYNKKIHKDSLLDGNYCEQIALNKCKKIILTSHWAINQAVKSYDIKKAKFAYLPFGANLKFVPPKKKLFNIIKNKKFDVCNFISIGVHWERKGMDRAVNLVNKINEKGQQAKLYIIGAKPINNNQNLDNVQIINFLDKNNIDQRKILENLYYKSHFNLLFSK